MAARKMLGESLGRGEDLTPDKMEKFIDVASSAIKGQRPLTEIAQATKEQTKSQEKTVRNDNLETLQKPYRNLSQSKKKMGRPARTGEKLRVVSLRLPESLDDALTKLAREREARREWPWTKWEIVAEGTRQFIERQGRRESQE